MTLRRRITNAKWLLLLMTLVISQKVCALEPTHDIEEKVVITPDFIQAIHNYDEVYAFHNGLAKVLKEGKCGFINTHGVLVIPCKLQFETDIFSDGYAIMIDVDGNVNFVNKTGKIRNTGKQIDYLYYGSFGYRTYPSRHGDMPFGVFRDGIVKLKINDNDEPVFFDKMLEVIDFDENNYLESEIAENTSNYLTKFESAAIDEKGNNITLYGLKDKYGKVVVPPLYWSIDEFHNGVANAILYVGDNSGDWRYMPDGLYIYGYIDENGNTTFTKEDFEKIEQYKRQHGY